LKSPCYVSFISVFEPADNFHETWDVPLENTEVPNLSVFFYSQN